MTSRTIHTAKALLPRLARLWAAAIAEWANDSPNGEIRSGADFDEPIHALEALDMDAWLKLTDAERVAAVAEYASRRPPLRTIRSDFPPRRRRRGGQ